MYTIAIHVYANTVHKYNFAVDMYIVALWMYTHILDPQRIKLELYILFRVIQLYAKNIVIFDI